MKITHLVKVYFDRRAARIDQAWLDARYQFFAENTLKSLQQQTVKDWTLWICCDAGMESMVDGLRAVVPANTIFTFGKDRTILPGDVPTEQLRDITDCDYVYATRIDSDDLYASDALQHVRDLALYGRTEPEAAIFTRGYIYDPRVDAVGTYVNPSSPFHTVMFPASTFFNPAKYGEWFVGDHSLVARTYRTHALPDYKFCVLIHGNNWLSTFGYGLEKGRPIPARFDVQQFLDQPVVFDVDDFCDQWDCLSGLMELKARYPNFKATLFTIPNKTSAELIAAAKNFPWIELAVHGFNHDPLDEILHLSEYEMKQHLRNINYTVYAKGFRSPGWHISSELIAACNAAGLWMAINRCDEKYVERMKSGHYICGQRLPYWHGHTHDVCGNWLKAALPELLKAWPVDQKFAWVSEAVLKFAPPQDEI